MKRSWFKILSILIFLVSLGLILKRNLPGILSASAPDFTQVLVSANAMLKVNDPYFNAELDYPNAYPPISEVFFLPLAFLTYHKALAVFTFLSFASIIASVFLSLKIVSKNVPWHYFLLFTALTLLSFPTKFSLGMGQINMIVLLLLILSVYLEGETKRYSTAAGISLGIAISLKPIFAFFLFFFLLNKSWKMIFASITTVLLLITLTLFAWPISFWVNWYKSGILPLTTYTSPQIYVYPNQGVFGFLYRIIAEPTTRIFLHKLTTIFFVAIAIYQVSKKKDYSLGFSFFMITLLIFDLTSWQHHFVWLMFSFILLVYNIIKRKSAVLLALICIAYLLISWNFKQPVLHPTILLSTQFYGAVILWLINLYFLRSSNRKIKNEKEYFFDLLELE